MKVYVASGGLPRFDNQFGSDQSQQRLCECRLVWGKRAARSLNEKLRPIIAPVWFFCFHGPKRSRARQKKIMEGSWYPNGCWRNRRSITAFILLGLSRQRSLGQLLQEQWNAVGIIQQLSYVFGGRLERGSSTPRAIHSRAEAADLEHGLSPSGFAPSSVQVRPAGHHEQSRKLGYSLYQSVEELSCTRIHPMQIFEHH